MERLIELRKERHVSQSELAEVLHMSQQAICKYELGQAEPDINTLKSMANYFHTSIDYLVGYSDNDANIEGYNVEINNQPITRAEINHLIAYRKLGSDPKEHIDSIINDLNNI